MSPSRLWALLGKRSRSLQAVEIAAVATIAAVIVLNIANVASRGKPVLDSGQPEAAAMPARERVAVKQRAASAPARPPAVSAQMFQPQRVILDATGVPALDPHRATPLPLKLDIVARVGDAAAVEAEPLAAGRSLSESLTVVPGETSAPAAKKRALAGKSHAVAAAKSRSGKRIAVAEDDQRSASTSLTVAKQAKIAEKVEKAAADKAVARDAKSLKVKLASRAVQSGDPTPGELVLRTLRGPA